MSSPSVAYRHLQKLEELDLLQKNEYGEYLVKQKINLRGFVWVGRRLVSKMLLYTLIFASILLVELIILGWHFKVETYEFKVFFVLLILITASAMGIFGAEALLQRRRINRSLKAEYPKVFS